MSSQEPSVNAFTKIISLYRKALTSENYRHIPQEVLTHIGDFKAAVNSPHIHPAIDSVSSIVTLYYVFLRVSGFYRNEFIKGRYIRYQEHDLRIISHDYNRLTGVLKCMCYG